MGIFLKTRRCAPQLLKLILNFDNMDDKAVQFNYFDAGMKMSVKCVDLLGKAFDGRNENGDGVEENERKLNESIQKLRDGLYDYARQENAFRESIDAVNVVRDEMHKKTAKIIEKKEADAE